MSNTDRAAAFLARLINLEQERRDNATDRKEIGVEMKAAELEKAEIAGIKLAVKRHFEEAEARQFRESVEEFAEALGGFKDTPLGAAAIRHVANKPGVRRAMKQSKKLAAEGIAALEGLARAPKPTLNDEVAAALTEAGIEVVDAP